MFDFENQSPWLAASKRQFLEEISCQTMITMDDVYIDEQLQGALQNSSQVQVKPELLINRKSFSL